MVAPQPDDGTLVRLAYEVSYRGKLLIDTSFLGYYIYDQLPLLGEKVGLVTSKTRAADARTPYNSLIAEYMQNGSLGRRINVEVRAYNGGVAFRYEIPRSTPLETFLGENEYTEFAFAKDGEADRRGKQIAIKSLSTSELFPLPFQVHLAGLAWVDIGEAGAGQAGAKGYPPMRLEHSEGNILMTKLPYLKKEPDLAIDRSTPMDSPWRVLSIASSRQALLKSEIANDLDAAASQ